MQTIVDFLRHGEVAGASCYRGSTDALLSEQGWQQMRTAIANKSWGQIISSPLHRCADFAQYASQQSNTPLSIEAGWQEFHFGDWEGKTAEQINSDALMLFYQDPSSHPPPNAEDFSAFLSRINQAWKSLLNQNQGQQVLVITHAGVIRTLFHLLLKLPVNSTFNLAIEHGKLTRFQCFQEQSSTRVQLEFHNLSAAHLPL